MEQTSESSSGTRKGWQGWLAALLTLLVGLFLIVMTFVPHNLFEVGPAFEDLIDDFRPLLQEEAVATAQNDIAGLGAVGEEFQVAVVPAISQALGMSPEEFGGFMGAQFPAVATGVAQLPAISEQFSGLIGTLDTQRDLFQSADEIPTEDLPATTVPWGIFLAGLAVVAVAVVMYFRKRLGALLAIGLGILLIVVPIVLSLPGKSADADDLNANLEPIYTAELVFGANTALATVSDMGAEMQTDMLPALSSQLQLSEEELGAFFGENFPATAGALASFGPTLGRFMVMTDAFESNLENYDVLKPVAFVPIIWSIIISGVAVLAFGAWGFVTARREE